MQLGLPFAVRPDYGAAFLPAGSNAAARRWLERPGDWPEGRLVLWGQAGCGKTHLAHRWAGAAGAWLEPGGRLEVPEAAMRVVVDGADGMADAASLLHLLNACAEARRLVLLTARAAPARWDVTLPDLTSRLRATPAIGIDPPEDALLRALLARLLAERQLAVSAPMQDWLLARLPRTAAALQTAAGLLDQASLAQGRRVTPALAQASLAGLLGDAPPG